MSNQRKGDQPGRQATRGREVAKEIGISSVLSHTPAPDNRAAGRENRPTIGQAVSEIRQRLVKVADAVGALREHMLGERSRVGDKEPRKFQPGLDAAIFEMFPVLAAIECDLDRVRVRLGVAVVNQSKPGCDGAP
jgi:hypothetical protein